MANDKDFVVNGPVVVGKDTKVTVGSIAAGTVDLSTGNYFTDTPTGDYTYTFANPGDVQAFQIQATGGSEAVASTFSTTLYDGTATSESHRIQNGIDLLNDGGLVWIKKRDSNIANTNHYLSDTERGNFYLASNSTNAQAAGDIASYNSDGWTFNASTGLGTDYLGSSYVSWSFKKQTKFFDIVTYTGDGVAGRTVAHDLGCEVGMMFIKPTSIAGEWCTYNRNLAITDFLYLNSTNDARTNAGYWNGTAPTDSVFSLGADSDVNFSGRLYVAYLFAHDTASDGLIQCGSYTGNGSSNGPEINLGWQPQWVLIKAATRPGGENWVIYDAKRGLVVDAGDPAIFPSDSAAEDFGQGADNSIDPLPTGFKIVGTSGRVNDSYDYIYMAIRSASAPAITWPTNIEWTAGSTPSTPAEGETDVYTFTTDDGGTTYTGVQSIDNAS